MLQFFGFLSGILAGSSYLPYVWNIFKGETKPQRVSWFIWTILGTIAFLTQLAEGASWSLLLVGLDTLGELVVLVLSIKFGVGGFSKKDIIALVTAGIGLILWFLTRHAVFALFITMFIDATGASLTITKAHKNPETETLSTWLIVALAGILAVVSVGKFNLVLLSYPLYIFLANFAVVVAIVLARRK